jgi:hypothetical protein
MVEGSLPLEVVRVSRYSGNVKTFSKYFLLGMTVKERVD